MDRESPLKDIKFDIRPFFFFPNILSPSQAPSCTGKQTNMGKEDIFRMVFFPNWECVPYFRAS